jgi:hypothetical protein
MPLSEDQRALLRLLAGGDTYEHVAGLLGTSPSDVRDRAGEAVAELERSGEDPELAEAAGVRLRELEEGPAARPAPSEGETPATDRRGLPRLAWVTIGAALAALVVAFAVVLLGGDSDDSPSSAPPRDQEDVIEIELEPVGGSGASGSAAIVRVADRPAIDVNVSGLAPSEPGETYVLWLLGSGDEGVPIAFRDVGPGGRFVGRTQVPAAAAGLLPSIDFIDLSVAPDDEVARVIKGAAENSTLPGHIGRSIVRGRLPR